MPPLPQSTTAQCQERHFQLVISPTGESVDMVSECLASLWRGMLSKRPRAMLMWSAQLRVWERLGVQQPGLVTHERVTDLTILLCWCSEEVAHKLLGAYHLQIPPGAHRPSQCSVCLTHPLSPQVRHSHHKLLQMAHKHTHKTESWPTLWDWEKSHNLSNSEYCTQEALSTSLALQDWKKAYSLKNFPSRGKKKYANYMKNKTKQNKQTKTATRKSLQANIPDEFGWLNKIPFLKNQQINLNGTLKNILAQK